MHLSTDSLPLLRKAFRGISPLTFWSFNVGLVNFCGLGESDELGRQKDIPGTCWAGV